MTVISRMCHDTKIILIGDLYLIDNLYVDRLSNGLSVGVETFRGEERAAHMLFPEGPGPICLKSANLL